MADNNAEIMEILAENKIIKDNHEVYIKMAKFGNVIVHDYTDLDPEIIHSILVNNISDLENFLLWIKEYIE